MALPRARFFAKLPRLMKKAMIELADTTFRAYRKKNGATALHLRSYLIVHTDAAFRAKWNAARAERRIILGAPSGLSLFLKGLPRCWVRLPGKEQHECDLATYSVSRVQRWAENSGLMILEDVSHYNKECFLHHFGWKRFLATRMSRIASQI